MLKTFAVRPAAWWVKVGGAESCSFPTDSCKFPAEDIMGAHNFNLTLEFS